MWFFSAVEVQKLFESEKYLPEEENQVEKHHSDNCGNSPEVPYHNTNEENSVTSMAKGIINVNLNFANTFLFEHSLHTLHLKYF